MTEKQATPPKDVTLSQIETEIELEEELATWNSLLNDCNRRINSFDGTHIEIMVGVRTEANLTDVARLKRLRRQAIRNIVGYKFFGPIYNEMSADYFRENEHDYHKQSSPISAG